MARTRYIKPDFFTDDRIVELDIETRLLFIGLWTIADREGRLENKPRQIKMKLFPADEVDVAEKLRGLSGQGFLSLYSVDSKDFIQIKNFVKHQRPHTKEAVSVIPPPTEPRNYTASTPRMGNGDEVQNGDGEGTTATFFGKDPNDPSPPPETHPKKPQNPSGSSSHPAVVVYEEIYGPVSPNFAKAISLGVKNLGVWQNLVLEKSSYPNPEKWIIGEYQKRVANAPPESRSSEPKRDKTARDFAREAIEMDAQNAREAEAKAAETGNGTSQPRT